MQQLTYPSRSEVDRMTGTVQSGSWQAWLLATRPKTLPASVAPVILGWAVAVQDGFSSTLLGLTCLAVAFFLQIAANLANDYFDARSGVDQADRLGPIRVTQSGLLRPGQVLAALIVFLLLAMAAGLFAAWHVGWWLLGLGAVCLVAALAYTAGPFPMARLGLGEVAALIFFGPVACTGTYAVLAGSPTPAAWAAGLVPGLHAAAIMAVNNLRDIQSDRRAGKVTLAVRMGERRARGLAMTLVVLGNLAAAPLARLSNRPLVLTALLLVIVSWPLLQGILRTPISSALNGILARTGQWELITCTITEMVSSQNSPPMIPSTISCLITTAMVPSIPPSASEPVSPMNTMAGGALNQRKPSPAPIIAAHRTVSSPAPPT